MLNDKKIHNHNYHLRIHPYFLDAFFIATL